MCDGVCEKSVFDIREKACDGIGEERMCDGVGGDSVMVLVGRGCVMVLVRRGCVIFCDDVGGERVCGIL